MDITSEMREVADYLSATATEYALFAGVAGFLLTGVEPSPDVDVFVSSPEDVESVARDFTDRGWNVRSRNGVTTLEKNGTTFDICFSPCAQKVLIPRRVQVQFEGKRVYSISPEALLLTKMMQVSSLERPDHKTKRDREVIYRLRKRIDPKKVRELLQDTDDSFWVRGF